MRDPTNVLQGAEVKRMYKELSLQPGDGLVFKRAEALPGGMPATKLTVLRAADNPWAPLILNSAATAQARRWVAGWVDAGREHVTILGPKNMGQMAAGVRL